MVKEFTGSPVRLEGISKKFGDFTAVDDVSFEVKAGEFVTLLGASGSGKTTLLRMIAGFLKPDEGRVFIAGKDLTDLPVHKRQIGMVFQNYALFPHMTVQQNVMFPLARQKFPKSERPGLVAEALRSVELEQFSQRKPSELSGGQQQRVALARAIVTRPRVLLMDEPLGALDRRLREALQIEIRRLSSDLGITVVNVTHDQEEALTMSDRIALLESGQLVQYAPPTTMFETPNSKTSASFLGESNLFEGRAKHSEGTWSIPQEKGVLLFPPQVQGLEAETKYLVMVRPSKVQIASPETFSDASSSFVHGTIRSVIYAGEFRKIFIQRHDGTEIIARLHASEAFDFHQDDPVIAYWNPKDSTVVEGTFTTGSPAESVLTS